MSCELPVKAMQKDRMYISMNTLYRFYELPVKTMQKDRMYISMDTLYRFYELPVKAMQKDRMYISMDTLYRFYQYFGTIFKNISVLLVGETGLLREKHLPSASN